MECHHEANNEWSEMPRGEREKEAEMQGLKVSATAIIDKTEQNFIKISEPRQLEMINRRLIEGLVEEMSQRGGFFTKVDRPNEQFSKTYKAECYVLTPRQFEELVEEIRRDVQVGRPVMLGGVS